MKAGKPLPEHGRNETEPRAHSPALSLREACFKAGRNGGGKRCLTCPIWHLCACDARWLVRLAEPAH